MNRLVLKTPLRFRKKDNPNYQDKELKAVKTAMLAMFDGFEDNVFSLSKEGKHVKVMQTTSMFGMDSNAILEDKMKTDSVSSIIKYKVSEMYTLIDCGFQIPYIY